MGAYADSPRISLLNFNVDIADRGIKRTRVCIGWSRIRARPTAREKHHVGGPLLKTWRVCSEHKCRPDGPKADHADSGPDVDRPGQTVAAGRNKKNALVRRLANLVDRLLQNSRVIRDSVPPYREIIRGQVNCLRVVWARRIVRGSEQRNSHRQ